MTDRPPKSPENCGYCIGSELGDAKGKLLKSDRNIMFSATLKRFALIATIPLLSACVPNTPVIEPASRMNNVSFWTPPQNTNGCWVSYKPVPDFSISMTLKRAPWPNDYAVNFARYVGRGLARTIARQGDQTFKEFYLSAARANAFTQPDYSGTWSPIYVQSTLIKQAAFYIAYTDKHGLLSANERQTLVDWVKPMIPAQKRKEWNTSADSRASSGAALLSWGSVTNNAALIARGRSQILEGARYVTANIGSLKRHPGHHGISTDKLSLTDEYNIAVVNVVEGAAMLNRMGENIFDKKLRGHSLHEAIEWWAGQVSPSLDGFTGYTRVKHNNTLGWMPIYISLFPDRPVVPLLENHIRRVAAGAQPMFDTITLSGVSNCLWDY